MPGLLRQENLVGANLPMIFNLAELGAVVSEVLAVTLLGLVVCMRVSGAGMGDSFSMNFKSIIWDTLGNPIGGPGRNVGYYL